MEPLVEELVEELVVADQQLDSRLSAEPATCMPA